MFRNKKCIYINKYQKYEFEENICFRLSTTDDTLICGSRSTLGDDKKLMS